MSCEFHLIGKIDGFDKCREFLGARVDSKDSWLRGTIVAVSPAGERLVLARGSAIIILTAKWDTNHDGNPHFVVANQWEAGQNLKQPDVITCVTCLPLVATGSASQGVADWTCIAVGFTSGYIRFFTENMDLLAEERLHPESILNIKATSFRKSSQSGSEGGETVYVLYPSVICSFAGFSLFQTLRGCRGQVAMKRARGNVTLPDVNFDYNKYAFASPTALFQSVRDGCFINCGTANNFDHLVTSSLNEGYNSNYKPSPPHHALVATTGDWPWLKYQYTQERSVASLELSDVALTVISKLPGWLGLASNRAPEPKVRAAEKLDQRFSLLDRRRQGKSLAVSPNGSLVAVADSLGRVSLIETRTGVAFRMWKGYRDAECGFIEVDEEISKSRHRRSMPSQINPRKALFLVLYCPKKGLVEIFALRTGPRVAALKVGKHGRLLYTPHGLMGFSTPPKGNSRNAISVTFVSEDGVMEVVVPFHCALTDESNARAKDLHLLKQLKIWLKGDDFAEDRMNTEVTEMVQKLTTEEVKLQTVEMLSHFSQITASTLLNVVSTFLDEVTDLDAHSQSSSGRNLHQVCKQLKDVLSFYLFLQTINKKQADEMPKVPISDILLMSERDSSILLEFIIHTKKIGETKSGAKVCFNVDAATALPRFLRCLDFGVHGPVREKAGISDEDFRFLGEFLFSPLIKCSSEVSDWSTHARQSDIHPMLFARSLITFWLQRISHDVEKEMQLFVILMKAVSSLPDEKVASSEYSSESPWWKTLREIISSSHSILTAVTVAVCCRSVSLLCEQEFEDSTKTKEVAEDALLHDWENVSADTWQWDLLIAHLEDTALLNIILNLKPKSDARESGIATVSYEPEQLSLAELLKRGEGTVSDLTARWLCQFGLTPDLIVEKSDVEFQSNLPKEESSQIRGRKQIKGDEEVVLPLIEYVDEVRPASEFISLIKGYVKTLKMRFPYSLTSSALLSNMSWVMFSSWHRDLSNVSLLEVAISYLRKVPSAQLRSGVANLAWTTYLKTLFEATCRLIGKVGRVPTDQLCSRELGIPRPSVSTFLNCICQLLADMLDATAERPQIPFLRRREALWGDGPSSLVSVAVGLPNLNEQLVLLHQQLATTLHLVAALDLRQPRLLQSLFDSLKTELFGELTKRRDIFLHHPGLHIPRSNFLLRAVTASVQTVQVVQSDDGGTRTDAETTGRWFRICCELAVAWRIPVDDLRRQYVCELYSCGYDRLAEETLSAVVETEKLGQQLLLILGQRLNALISSSEDPAGVIANFSPTLTAWLDKLDEEGLKESCTPLEDTELLATRVSQYLPNDVFARLLSESVPGLAA